MNIYEAAEAFNKQFKKLIDMGVAQKTNGEEQITVLQLAVPGYNFDIYGADDDADNLDHFLTLFCDYANGETNIKTNNMIWFKSNHYVVLLWEEQKED